MSAMPPTALTLRALALGALLLAACNDTATKLQSLCAADSECQANFACVDGRCICQSDAACASNELCNSAGFCQPRVGCETSIDCPASQFCDRTTGNCLDGERCTSDVQCAVGEVCDLTRFKCVVGCRGVGDCTFGAVCLCPSNVQKCEPDVQSCPPSTEACDLGKCQSGPCGDKSYCRYGESCLAQADGGPKRCVKDDRGPFCDPCTIGPSQSFCPGASANFCLIDASKAYGSAYCGVECAEDNECPWGFECSDVLVLTSETCGSSGQSVCRPRPGMTCAADADCKGGECDPSTKLCKPSCVGGEGDQQGFCTCLSDGDCPADDCGSDGRCRISRALCDANTPCANIYCVNRTDKLTQRSVGYCKIGRNCAPAEGVTCDEVRSVR